MTGMKKGAGEDPFADDTAETNTREESDEATPSDGNPAASGGARTSQNSMSIPYKFRRDSVQDGRDRVPLFLQPATKDAERDALEDLETRFDDNVSLTDLREALVAVGLQHLDEVEGQLEDWGYGMRFDE
ncbi:hypothetical protein [Haloarchaeobius amylolyticus]|uniref:hypothetical protein n=1 Tax=Haloarchaeobius amylolyticus TaxID=1198296 RepID=UPI0022703425|nr:hypothetical protein [Haloarchaeobius amylolyticus]